MFNYKEMIKRAVEYFPLWSDIRKRTNKSIGGQLVDSALKETLEIESAIKQYKDFYFLTKYEGKEDDVVAFVYATTIGKIDNVSNIEVIYNEVSYLLTIDINEFYDNKNYVYYENGILYVKEETVNENKNIDVYLDNQKYTYVLSRQHVWNIFDEYAIFVGLERYENETNKQLKDRILFATKNPGNATEQGLKNSIITELMSIIDIEEKDIDVSRVTPENLMKPYKEYKNLLSMLDTINKDCLKDKRWDLDKWEYNFKSISFLDNV